VYLSYQIMMIHLFYYRGEMCRFRNINRALIDIITRLYLYLLDRIMFGFVIVMLLNWDHLRSISLFFFNCCWGFFTWFWCWWNCLFVRSSLVNKNKNLFIMISH
jgi:hypothetical protein